MLRTAVAWPWRIEPTTPCRAALVYMPGGRQLQRRRAAWHAPRSARRWGYAPTHRRAGRDLRH
eukprot:11225222-Lingulodinium_polyedra.AAC.1